MSSFYGSDESLNNESIREPTKNASNADNLPPIRTKLNNNTRENLQYLFLLLRELERASFEIESTASSNSYNIQRLSHSKYVAEVSLQNLEQDHRSRFLFLSAVKSIKDYCLDILYGAVLLLDLFSEKASREAAHIIRSTGLDVDPRIKGMIARIEALFYRKRWERNRQRHVDMEEASTRVATFDSRFPSRIEIASSRCGVGSPILKTLKCAKVDNVEHLGALTCLFPEYTRHDNEPGVAPRIGMVYSQASPTVRVSHVVKPGCGTVAAAGWFKELRDQYPLITNKNSQWNYSPKRSTKSDKSRKWNSNSHVLFHEFRQKHAN